MKKFLYLIILALLISANSFADLKPLYPKKYETGKGGVLLPGAPDPVYLINKVN